MRFDSDDPRSSISGVSQDIPEELRGQTPQLPNNIDIDKMRQELADMDLTVQLEQFIDTFLENVTLVAFKAIKNNELKPQDAYHEFRQLLVYVRGFRLSMYDPECSEELVRFFDTQMPKAVQPQDQNILINYTQFFKDFFEDFFNISHYKYQARIVKHIKEAKRYLEQDYGYEPHLTV